MDEVQVESHWEQGSANEADVRQAWGGTAGWGGAKQHRREALGTLREREVERGEKLQRQYKTGNQHAKKLEPWPPVWQTNKVTLLLSARAQIVDRAFFFVSCPVMDILKASCLHLPVDHHNTSRHDDMLIPP